MKTQMKFQKWLCLALLIVSALTIVVALGYTTGVLSGFASTLKNSTTPGEGKVAQDSFPDAYIFREIQSFNNVLLVLGIVCILAVVLLYITATNKRRNYYISNYVISIAVAAILIGVSLYVFIANGSWFGQVLDIINDSEAMDAYYALYQSAKSTVDYSTNTTMFILTFVVYGVEILGAIALIVNLIWKNKLMQGEKALLEKGLDKEVA